jgi:hypothetical protein
MMNFAAAVAVNQTSNIVKGFASAAKRRASECLHFIAIENEKVKVRSSIGAGVTKNASTSDKAKRVPPIPVSIFFFLFRTYLIAHYVYFGLLTSLSARSVLRCSDTTIEAIFFKNPTFASFYESRSSKSWTKDASYQLVNIFNFGKQIFFTRSPRFGKTSF